jgi:hypothetical protein
MPARLVAQVPRVDLQRPDAIPHQGEAVPRERVGERLDRPPFPRCGLRRRAEFPFPRHRTFRPIGIVPSHMESFSAILRIWTP